MQAIVRNLPSDAARTALRAGSAARGWSSRLLLMANSSPSGARLPRTRQLPYTMRTTDGVAAPQLRERVTHTRGRVRGSNVRAPSPTLPYAARPATRPTISSDPTPQARQLADRVGPSGRCSTLPQRLTFRNTGPKPRGFEGRRTPRRRGGRDSPVAFSGSCGHSGRRLVGGCVPGTRGAVAGSRWRQQPRRRESGGRRSGVQPGPGLPTDCRVSRKPDHGVAGGD